jgi:protein-S-isoprenylcysteine O-methyltransferase Ste14
LLGSVLFFVIAPGTVAGYLPWTFTHWHMRTLSFFGAEWTRWLGAALIAFGLVPLVNSFWRFAMEGLGTPAPIAPPQTLVVTGFYRRVRNPMYVGIVAIVFGQALLFASWGLVWYAALMWLCFHLFVFFYEEPTLRKSFPANYKAYCANVPRWLPRLATWKAADL